ncbi:MAG: 1-acyl-sn-glycerol-3-phosphate acyltransferase [Caulobacteraceae bacterium]|nr:1-acyl-sn-glycerol-3-phosphate acyltransferase [Caulobacteraceae bacterium]
MARVARPRDHIIDRLIAERAPRLAASAAWPLIRPLLYLVLDYGKARRMADAIAPLSGRAALAFISDLLRVTVEARGLERVPRAGRLIAVCNHPTGIADAVAVWDALGGARPDMMFYANADAHRVAPRFDELLIPVQWMDENRTRERTRITLTLTRRAMEAERALIIFPAGRLARRSSGRALADPPWASGAFSVARRYEAPVLPMHLSGPWSTLFHFFNEFSGELRDITLFHELLNKRGKRFDLLIGRAVAPADLPADAVDAAVAMKAWVEHGLPRDPDGAF